MTDKKLEGEELAKHWDRFVVNTWFKYPNARCGRTMLKFLDEYGDKVNRDEFLTLKRVPHAFLAHLDLRFWINRTMFPIWEKLIEIKEDDVFERVEILKLMKNWKLSCKNFRRGTLNDRELQKQKHLVRQSDSSYLLNRKAVDDLYGNHRRSNQWNVCK